MKVLSFPPYNSSAAENSRCKRDHGSAAAPLAEVRALMGVRCGTHTHKRAQWTEQCAQRQHMGLQTPQFTSHFFFFWGVAGMEVTAEPREEGLGEGHDIPSLLWFRCRKNHFQSPSSLPLV